MKKTSLISLGKYSLILLLCLASASAAQAAEQALFLKQKSLMLGRTEMLYCKDGIKFDLYEKSQILYMRPPLWNVQICHTKTKLYWEGDAKTFKSSFNSTCAMFRPGDPSTLKPGTSTKAEQQGLQCNKFDLSGQKISKEEAVHTWQKLLVRNGFLWALPVKDVPAVATRVLNLSLGTPVAPGIPLVMTVYNNGGSHSQELELIGVQHKAATAADFKVPNGFKRVSKPEQLVNTKALNEDFAEMLK